MFDLAVQASAVGSIKPKAAGTTVGQRSTGAGSVHTNLNAAPSNMVLVFHVNV